MTTTHARQFARAVMVGSVLFNAGLLVVNVAWDKYEPAAMQSIVVAFLAVWLYVTPKVDAWLDARLAEATANQRTAEIASAELERMQRAGELRVGMSVQGRHSERMH